MERVVEESGRSLDIRDFEVFCAAQENLENYSFLMGEERRQDAKTRLDIAIFEQHMLGFHYCG